MTLSSALLFFRPGRLWVTNNVVSSSDYGIITVDATGPAITGNQQPRQQPHVRRP